MKKLKAFWNNKWKIIAGIWNTYFSNKYIEKIAASRDEICKSNKCGYYDKDGIDDACFVPNSACCAACGCKLTWKQRSLSSSCGLETIEKTPLWKSVMSEQQEENFRNKANIINE